MKIIKLMSENIKRLHAIEIVPEGNLITIGGRNNQGKSSVLDSIAYAIGGEKLVPTEPIRAGETDAKITVSLDDLVVTRKFSRDRVHQDHCSSFGLFTPPETKPACNCTPTFTETKSTLVVTNREGARYPSPQAVLDKLTGKLTFDPLKFKDLDPKVQDAELRKLVGLDVSQIEAKRKAAFDQRAMLKKTLAIKEAQLAALPKYDGVGPEEIPLAEVSAEMLKAEEYRRLADDTLRSVGKAQDARAAADLQLSRTATSLEVARKRVAELEAELAERDANALSTMQTVDALQITYDAALAVVPDVAVLRAKLTEVEATNVKVRANATRNAAQGEVTVLAGEVAVQHAAIADAEHEKDEALASATFPVPGLGLSDEGVTFGGLPFGQASSSEQLRVSVAIGIALNPTLKVLLIRNGNMLDDDSLKMVAAQAEAAEMQTWVEYVTANAEGVSVMIEDGEVKK